MQCLYNLQKHTLQIVCGAKDGNSYFSFLQGSNYFHSAGVFFSYCRLSLHSSFFFL